MSNLNSNETKQKRKPFYRKDWVEILKIIDRENWHTLYTGQKMWEKIEEMHICQNTHPWSSLRDHFIKIVSTDLLRDPEYYELTPENLKKFKQAQLVRDEQRSKRRKRAAAKAALKKEKEKEDGEESDDQTISPYPISDCDEEPVASIGSDTETKLVFTNTEHGIKVKRVRVKKPKPVKTSAEVEPVEVITLD